MTRNHYLFWSESSPVVSRYRSRTQISRYRSRTSQVSISGREFTDLDHISGIHISTSQIGTYVCYPDFTVLVLTCRVIGTLLWNFTTLSGLKSQPRESILGGLYCRNSSSANPFSFVWPFPYRTIFSRNSFHPEPVLALKSPNTTHISLLAIVFMALVSWS